jgi:hypothetical protein
MQFVTIGNKICPGVEMFNHRCRNRQVIPGHLSAIADTSGVMILGDCPGNRYSPEAYNLTDGVAAQARLARDRALPSIETAFRLTIVHRLVHPRPQQQQQQNNRAEGPRAAGYRAPAANWKREAMASLPDEGWRRSIESVIRRRPQAPSHLPGSDPSPQTGTSGQSAKWPEELNGVLHLLLPSLS